MGRGRRDFEERVRERLKSQEETGHRNAVVSNDAVVRAERKVRKTYCTLCLLPNGSKFSKVVAWINMKVEKAPDELCGRQLRRCLTDN